MLATNLFPVTVTLPDGSEHSTCRLYCDGRHATVWKWSGSEFVVVVEAPADDVVANGQAGYIKLPDGVASFSKGGGCGCGHPLKSTTPTLTAGARRVYTNPKVAQDG